MIIKSRFELPLGLTLFLLWLQFQFPIPLIKAREIRDHGFVFPVNIEEKGNNHLATINETEQLAAQTNRKTIKNVIENITKESRTRYDSTESYKYISNKTIRPIIEFGPRITLETLPICKDGQTLSGKHCRKEA